MKNEVSWKYEIGQRIVEYNNKNIIKDITIIDRKIEVEKLKDKRKQKGFTTNNIKYYKYKCNLCEFRCDEHYKNGEYKEEYWIRESFIKHSNCLFCTGQIVISGVNDISTTHPHLIKYFKNIEDTYKYSYGSNKKLIFKCPDCGFEKEYKINVITIHGFSCTICSDGIKYPNKFSYELLNQLNKTYKFAYLEHEYSPDWIGKMSYDNYFIYNGKEYIIEMDGGFHNKDNNMSGQTKEESKLIDDYKDKLAKEHKIEVVRIDCDYGNELNKRFELIKDNILSSNKLNQIFDLNKIDWLKCNEFACDNLIKEVCKIWNTDKYTTVTLSKEVKLSLPTIIKYLKIGNLVNWCLYNPTIERKKSIIEVGKMNGKEIMCIETKQKFESARDCARKSLGVFGIKMTASLINQVCNGLRNHHHGYHFCFI